MTDQEQVEIIIPEPTSARPKNQVVPQDEPQVPNRDLVTMAVARGAPLEYVREMMAIKKEWEADEARKAYNRAFSKFKSEAITIVRGKQITDGPLKGKFYSELHNWVKAITPALSKYGLSHAWKLTKDEKDWIEVTCFLRHEDGHSESVSMGGPPDTGGAKNAIQARASSVSYLEKYTFKAITGLADEGDDTDGNVKKTAYGTISEEQVLEIDEALENTKSDKTAFLEYMGVDQVMDIPADKYKKAIGIIREKARRAREGAK